MQKFLIFDTDRSLATIGGAADILKCTGGIPEVPISGGVMQIKEVLDKLWTFRVIEEEHKLLGIKFKTSKFDPTPACKELGIDGIVIDTISQLFAQDKRILEDKNGGSQLEQRDWGKLERLYTSLLQTLVDLPVWVIVTSHIKYDKNAELGTFYFGPQLAGQSSTNIPKYFDCVFFTKTSIDQQKKRVFQWQTMPDHSKAAKDRKSVLDGFIPQSHKLVLQKYAEAGVPYPKILIIGESGAGKTKSLTTINQ